jgi:sulfatase maturation enzyme AslB (radical SAM superfamily)
LVALKKRRSCQKGEISVDWETATRLILKVAQAVPGRVYGYVKVGYACNNSCLFCTAAWKRKHGDRDTRTILDELERIVCEDRVGTMVYSGGEPTVRPDLPEILRYAKGLGVAQQNLQTNARKLSEKGYLEDLRDAGLTSCFVSIHAPRASVHDWLTQSAGAFDQTCAGLANLGRLDICSVTNTVICRQNFHLLSELVTFLGRSFPTLRAIKLSYPRLQGGAAANLTQVVAPLWEVAPYVREAIDTGADMGVYVETEFVPICLLGTRFDRADNYTPARVNLSDLAFVDPNYCRPSGEVFYECCNYCDVRSQCLGIDALHHEAFGENSCFAPVSFGELAH